MICRLFLTVSFLFFLSASVADATSQIDFSGYLRLRAYGLTGYWQNTDSQGANDRNEQYATSRFRVNVSFKPTDELEIKWRLHGPHNSRWGSGDSGYGLTTRYVYGIVKTEYGKISIGRISADFDSAGLQTLGYYPVWGLGAQAFVFDVDSEDDGIMYRHDWENGLGIKAFYAKKESDATGIGSDQDYDKFSVEPYYKWDDGGISLAVQYDRNMGQNQKASTSPPGSAIFYDTNYHLSLNPAFMYKWNLGGGSELALHLEGKYAWGKIKTGPGSRSMHNENVDGAGLYADLTYKYGLGDLSLAAWWFNGSADGSGKHDLVNPGEGFYPFVVFYTGHPQARSSKNLEGNQASNHWAAALMGNHSFTPELQLNYGVAHFGKAKVEGNVPKNMGTEIDLGLTIQLLDNLTLSTKVGYFMPGDYYKEQYRRSDYNKNITAWGSELIFHF